MEITWPAGKTVRSRWMILLMCTVVILACLNLSQSPQTQSSAKNQLINELLQLKPAFYFLVLMIRCGASRNWQA
ncbi:MAG: hypothetical protein CMJ78_07935 [Planctomycetaceae bacterium]|nr:hypothetical protein [Planctomycetaceae bacterium]